jgi:hypothetical protein
MSIYQGLKARGPKMAHCGQIDDDWCAGRGLERHVYRVLEPDGRGNVDLTTDR